MLPNIGGGGYFGDQNASVGYQDQNPSGIMNVTGRAVIYVFKPFANQFRDVSLRPFQYGFTDNFLYEMKDKFDASARQNVSPQQVLTQIMQKTNLNAHMSTSFQPTMTLRSSLLSDNWRFILILTESPRDLIGGNTAIAIQTNTSQIRYIYSGYFTDEPYNELTYSQHNQTLNERAMMVITHKTKIGNRSEHGAWGSKTVMDTKASEEFIHPQIAKDIIAREATALHVMTPRNSVNEFQHFSNGQSIAMPGVYSDVSKDNGVNAVQDLFENPAQNVGHVIRGMMLFQDRTTSKDRLGYNKMGISFGDPYMDESMGRMDLARELDLPRPRRSSPFDLDENASISPATINKMVSGDMDVIPVHSHRPTYYDTTDQSEQSFTNQFSSLIASTISPILNAVGLNSLEFRYQIAEIQGRVDPHWTVVGAEPISPALSNQDVLQIVNAVKYELHYGIFDSIYQSQGAFQVVVKANTTGMTVVRLDLVDRGIRAPADFELPSCLGGFVSPLLGDDVSNSCNSQSIEGLYGMATGMLGGAQGGFGSEDELRGNHRFLSDDSYRSNTAWEENEDVEID